MQLPVAIIETINQSTKHRNNTHQHLLSLKYSLFSRHPFGDERIQAGCAFCRRTARIVKELCPHWTLTFAVAFRGVEQHRKAGPIQLVTNFAGFAFRRSRHLFQQRRHPCNETQFQLISIQLLVVKHGRQRLGPRAVFCLI